MTSLYNRIRRITVGNIDVSGFDTTFRIKSTLRRQSNTCELRIYNLTSEQATTIRNTENLRVEVAAGYKSDGEPTLLFLGEAKDEVFIKTERTEIILDIKAHDGSSSLRSRTNRSYNPGVPVRQVLEDLASDLGVGIGNLNDFTDKPLVTTNQNRLSQGFVASGPTWTVFDRVVRASGNRWSIQNGNIQILPQRRTNVVAGKLLNSSTGLLGSPTRDKNGKVQCRVLLQSGVEPGKLVRLQSRLIEGDFEVQETVYRGSTVGSNPDWFADLTLKPLSTRN